MYIYTVNPWQRKITLGYAILQWLWHVIENMRLMSFVSHLVQRLFAFQHNQYRLLSRNIVESKIRYLATHGRWYELRRNLFKEKNSFHLEIEKEGAWYNVRHLRLYRAYRLYCIIHEILNCHLVLMSMHLGLMIIKT